MSFLDKILGRSTTEPDPFPTAPDGNEPVQSIVVPASPFVHLGAIAAASLRQGMWVLTKDDQVGILTGCRLDTTAEVTLIKPDGTTQMVLDANDRAVPAIVLCALSDLRPACVEDIPKSRHDGADHLRSFGYKMRGE